MKSLTIKNIGAIKDVTLELKRVNVIMGPQSSGKSTICKIASYCKWVEKKISLSPSFESFLSPVFLDERLIDFHKLNGYFSENSYIKYETDTLMLIYDFKLGHHFEWKDRCGYQRSKVAYIPSERNLVSVINNWFEVRFKDTNIRSFMIDWDDSRKNYSKENPLDVLNMKMKYYYDDNTGKDTVIIDNAKSLELTDTSSGLQSLIPLLVLANYLVTRIKDLDEKSSVANEQLKKKVIQAIYEEFGEVAKSNIEYMFKTQSVSLYIEEPELNLFPLAQRDLLYELIHLMLSREDDSLTITTHSPYILYALNNCMMGYLVKDRMPEGEQKEVYCKKAWIDPLSVSVWEIKDGYLIGLNGKQDETIQQADGLIGNNYFDSNMKEIMEDFYKMLNYYGNDSSED